MVDRHTQQHSTPSPCVRPLGWSTATRSPLLPDLLLGPATRWRTAASADFAKVRIGAAPSSGAGRRGPHTPLCYTNSHERERGPGYCGWLAGSRAACRASAYAGPRSRRAGLSAVGLGNAAGFASACRFSFCCVAPRRVAARAGASHTRRCVIPIVMGTNAGRGIAVAA